VGVPLDGRTQEEMHTSLHWIAFNLFVVIAVALDLGVFHRKAHKIAMREALLWSFAWIVLALTFGSVLLYFNGRQPAMEFLTGYVVEKALSVDNLFVFLVVFRVFAVRDEYQQRVLGYGILGALILRGAMIAAGAALIEHFSWIMYVFGAFIVLVGIHMLIARHEESDPQKNFLVRYFSKHLRLTKEYSGEKFFTRLNGEIFATPLFLVLLVVEITDVTFAVDSIPAVFGITRDPFIVFTSNVFAILGLRALYFLLATVLEKLQYLKIGLAVVLIFVGAKMIAEPWLKISVELSFGIVLGMLSLTVLFSLLAKKNTTESKQ
jgi:tellurite resistance protein TerC